MTYQCVPCGIEFDTRRERNDHVFNEHGEEIFGEQDDEEQSTDDTVPCEEMFCEEKADVTLINNRTAEEHAYCLDHAEEALDEMQQLNVGRSVPVSTEQEHDDE